MVYIDNRGSGQSAKGPQSSYSLDNNVDDIEALRQHLGLGKILLLGLSYGGMTALEYARRYQENLLGLLLAVTAPSYHFIQKSRDIVKNRGTEEQQKMVEVLLAGGFESEEQQNHYYKVMLPLYSHTFKETPESIKAAEDAGRRSNRSYEALNEGFGGFLREFDVTGFLEEIHVPTLIIGGRHDWITPIEASLLMHEKIKGSRLVIFENSSHSVTKDEYEKFITTITEFVKSEFVAKAVQYS